MRPIKFRAWDSEGEEFVYSYEYYEDAFFQFEGDRLIAYRICDKEYGPPQERAYTVELEKPQMSTTLTDKNGQEIWERDILAGEDGIYLEVVWNLGAFFIREADQLIDPLCTYRLGYFEVIGNVHEHKHLLEGR